MEEKTLHQCGDCSGVLLKWIWLQTAKAHTGIVILRACRFIDLDILYVTLCVVFFSEIVWLKRCLLGQIFYPNFLTPFLHQLISCWHYCVQWRRHLLQQWFDSSRLLRSTFNLGHQMKNTNAASLGSAGFKANPSNPPLFCSLSIIWLLKATLTLEHVGKQMQLLEIIVFCSYLLHQTGSYWLIQNPFAYNDFSVFWDMPKLWFPVSCLAPTFVLLVRLSDLNQSHWI